MKLLTLAALFVSVISLSHAQTYPTKTVRIIVGLAPGGTTDVFTRTLAQRLTEAWGQTVIVENRPGASGMIGAEAVAKAAPDGYTLLVSPQTSLAVAPALYGKAPYDTAKDFAPVSLLGSTPLVMIVHPSFPAKSFAEFVALAKKGTPLTYGSGGVGSSPHMTGELLSAALGVKMNHVPYKGENPAIADTIGGQIPIMFGNLPVALPHVRSGRVVALATTTAQRSPLAPEIPTMSEGGIKDFEMATWYGMLAPAGTPPELVQKIQRDAARVLSDAQTRDRLTQMGVDLILNTPEEFRTYLNAEIARYTKIIKSAGLKAE
ncbi:MAG TPA: tripartite tricarboxylate transporter substrate binding protein [Burkholderiales bacterium]|jgi:tripartite-type tricarboxylate transporter receptor subunit TctC|nr:tripartite tricarboxylate transporter substrate binding protein [Burkholderiales bacterium]